MACKASKASDQRQGIEWFHNLDDLRSAVNLLSHCQ